LIRNGIRPERVRAFAFSSVLLLFVACGSGQGGIDSAPVVRSPASSSPTSVTTVVQVASLSDSQLQALALICHRFSAASGFDAGDAGSTFGPVREAPLTPSESAELVRQWQIAAAAALSLGTPEQAAAAGYVKAGGFQPGIGIHWINWSLVGEPFQPGMPSMLLFDGLPNREVRLVGFSYWVGGDQEPLGFAGPNDHWHRHSGLCFSKDGQLVDQNVRGTKCEGYWLNAEHLWMLHAWVVPGLVNIWGRFAPTSPYLCPPRGTAPEIASCPELSAA